MQTSTPMSSRVQITDDDDHAAEGRPVADVSGPAGASQRETRRSFLPGKVELLRALWQTSHFGWIPEAALGRGLTIAGGHEIPLATLREGLRELREHGWAEPRHGDIGQPEWRLTDNGRRQVA